MDASKSKAQCLNDLSGEYAQWDALLDEIGEEHMTQAGAAGEWLIKDIVAYMTGGRRSALGCFQAVLRHEPPPLPPWPTCVQTTDEINAWIYASNQDRALAEALLESHGILQQLMDVFSPFSEAELLDPTRFPWLEGEQFMAAALFAHLHEAHEPDWIPDWIGE